ncbi:alanine dehydrogenase [Slackia heliotrinireducens]|uniref:Predicted ornithine cyclodeaminase, mu-crystallin n=1 Tax=Slackia heliotrinireducens (strain ATCC 29202 / DSM 20476 / NCTC 11029 / RHS 1) TaxID=471855 RepID=C7N659_SLAHD|nr:ornithine cyclodeaminase family protein [Slackia heliotrinireducens]ACV22394.1 predicted ornithine cyclodeaminase, mu-crystallin [Slackia heliotrinireducens DSM 20476]VEH00703.1 alanine dehydrogenase [Slackia heliotrinireducens]
MSEIRILSAEDIAKVFTVTDALKAVEDAYAQKANGTGKAWPMVYAQFEPGVADMDIRSGELAGSGLFGLKLTAWFSKNPSNGLPEIFGTTLICSDITGEPLALLNASAITALRTGAAAALGIKHLARKNPKSLLMAGTGHMSAYCVAATLAACPSVSRVLLWNPSKSEAPVARLTLAEETVHAVLTDAGIDRDFDIVAVADGESACAEADAIITATPSYNPFLKAEWVKPGTHISTVGADMEGKQETESALQAAAKLFVDDREQSMASGELEIPVKEGAISPDDIAGELGQVIVGQVPGRTADDQITLFDTSGIAVQDLASCKLVYDHAVELGLGSVVAL